MAERREDKRDSEIRVQEIHSEEREPLTIVNIIKSKNTRNKWKKAGAKLATKNAIGFVPDENVPDDRFHKMKRYVAVFVVLGIICGIGSIVLGCMIISMASDFNGQLENDTGILAESNFATYGYPMINVGEFVFFVSLLGAFAIYHELFLFMLIYSIICAISVGIGWILLYSLYQYEDFEKELKGHLQIWWLAIAHVTPDIARNIERDHACCGWYNVFDYCSTNYMSIIMYDTMVGKSLTQFLTAIDATDAMYGKLNDDDHEDYGDAYGENIYGDTQDYGENIYDDTEDYGDKCTEMSNNAHHAGDPPWLDFKCRKNTNGSVVDVRNGCYQHQDKYGDEICHLNGCSDIVNRKAKIYILIPLGVFSIVYVISYTVGLYFNLILSYHYYGEYKKHVELAQNGHNNSQIKLFLTHEASKSRKSIIATTLFLRRKHQRKAALSKTMENENK